MSRAFVVFQDFPSSPAKPRASPSPDVATTTPSSPATAATLTEKENLHPLTGERTIAASSAKKRKTAEGILATKLHNPPTHSKKQKASLKEKDGKPDPKRRKASASLSLSASSSKSSSLKARKERKSGSSSSRALSRRLPRVEEDGESDRERVAQAEINSKCYDLTVLPLADVTPAYELNSESADTPSLRTVKESSAEPEIRDYFAPALSHSSPPRCKRTASESKTKVFTTPERKEIWAAFTFASPSPSAKRFGEVVAGLDYNPAALEYKPICASP
ncbi:hypothetical protein PLICRDRAFT_54668 [Plicaturopsis crispa FD-325 SS-3]|nr:hypothetical protein PLICRDRAFT_54668 [Plicaturopsis crispa FD-325 SS-3]